MTVTIPCYCSREMVAEALDVKLTARANTQIDRCIQSATTMDLKLSIFFI